LEANQASGAAVRGVRDLCAMFSGSEAKAAEAFLKSVNEMVPSASRANGPLLNSVIPALSSLRTFVDALPNKDLNNSLDSLLDVLQSRADIPISVFVATVVSGIKEDKRSSRPKSRKKVAAPMDDRLVDKYVRRLEAALGDDAKFESLLVELSADACVQQAEAVAIASQFYKRTTKDTSRPKALQRIRERQTELMKFKRQSSTAGRPAA
jgi:hypothetical protein